MNNNNLRDARVSSLRNGKVKGMRFSESIPLRVSGRIDGRRGLPREDNTGQWVSPRIEREIRYYDEFAARQWGLLQIEQEQTFSRLGELLDSVVHTYSQLEEASAALAEAAARERTDEHPRKYGEDKLTDAQVAARRARERESRLAPARSRVATLRAQLSSELDALSQVRNKIVEDINTTRMVCNRVKEHLYQRLAVYWNSALRKHSQSGEMPVVPCVAVLDRAEEAYLEPHKALMQKADQFIRTYSAGEKKEVA